MSTAINVAVTFIVTFMTFFFMFRIGFMVGRNLTMKKLFHGYTRGLQKDIHALVCRYHDANYDLGKHYEHFFSFNEVKTMLVIALTTIREE